MRRLAWRLLLLAPLSLLMLGAMGLAFLLGALATWFAGIGARLRARRAERTIAALRAELDAARTRAAPAPALLPPVAQRAP